MYEESKKRFNWKGFLLKLILICLIVFLVFKLLPINRNVQSTNGYSKVFNTNFTRFKEVGNNYFTKDKLPSEDQEVKVSLKELIKEKKISTLKDVNGKSCNEDDSFIRSYKKNIGYELEVNLECGEEKDTSYIYLGCFDDCVVTTKNKKDSEDVTTTNKTTTTSKEITTTKENITKSSNDYVETTKKKTTTKTTKTTTKKVSVQSYSNNPTTKTTTTSTTTKVKRYAVIFNENGGTKVSTQNVVQGNKAIKPSDPTKRGFVFKGWYLNEKLYDFNSSVNDNIILMAKWVVADETLAYNSKITKTYEDTLFSVAIIASDSVNVKSKTLLSIPEKIKNYENVRVKSVSYIRNFNSEADVDKLNLNGYSYKNFGIVDNVEVNVINNILYWEGLVSKKTNYPVRNTSGYGIVVHIVWEYNI